MHTPLFPYQQLKIYIINNNSVVGTVAFTHDGNRATDNACLLFITLCFPSARIYVSDQRQALIVF